MQMFAMIEAVRDLYETFLSSTNPVIEYMSSASWVVEELGVLLTFSLHSCKHLSPPVASPRGL